MTPRLLRWLLATALLAGAGSGVAFAQSVEGRGTEPAQFRFERQLRVNPFDPAAMNNLAVVKASQGRYGDARELLQRASRLAPGSSEIEANRSRLKAWMETAGEAPQPVTGAGVEGRLPPEPPRLWDPVP